MLTLISLIVLSIPSLLGPTEDAEAKEYFENHLKLCKANEIRCVWFLRDEQRIGMLMTIDLTNSTIYTGRDVFNWALQGQHTRELSKAEIKRINQIISELPAPDKNVDFTRGVSIAIRKEDKVLVRRYDRRNAPKAIRSLYDISQLPLPEEKDK